jgi:DNA (cytosine-5)-methyltransferase 1
MLREDEIIVDNFAGGGGASEGIEQALAVLAPGRHVDIAINHDPEAVALHKANHPKTEHYCQSVWKADPRDVTQGRPVGLAWFSPDCKHFSKAKGGKPVEKKIRDLAWVVVHWGKLVRPRIIMLENVEEFRDWGPLIETAEGKLIPCPLRKGFTFKRWVRELKKLGYVVEYRELRACDYGTPTIRKRLFLIARCDGEPIVWPKVSHKPAKVNDDGIVTKWARGNGLTLKDIQGLKPWRTAAECIDWSLPCPSIFDRKKPLAEATLKRIARGIQRYVLEASKPFIVRTDMTSGAHKNGLHDFDEPMRTQMTSGSFAAVEPFVVPITHHGDDRCHAGGQPMRTITTAHRGEMSVVVPSIVGVGGRAGQSRPRGGDEPLQTFTAKADSALVAAHLTKFRSGATGSDMADPAPTVTANSFIKRPGGAPPMGVVAAHLQAYYGEGVGGKDRSAATDEPLRTQTTENRHAIVAATMVQTGYGEREGQAPRALDIERPAGTAVAGGAKAAVVAAFLAQHNTGVVGHDAREAVSTIVGKGCTQAVVAASLMVNTTGHSGAAAGDAMPTVTTGGHHAAVAAHMLSLKGSDRRDRPAEEPAASICAEGTHAALIAAFMQKYYGTGGQDAPADDPMHTATTKARLGLVTVTIEGETYIIVDIGMRMLSPRELYRAQGFRDSYIIDPIYNGKPLTKTAQIRMCGNSVCPPMSEALVMANFAVPVAASEVA